jgi:hypothetical protein
VLAYALMPVSYLDPIEAASLAEAFGGLFLIVYATLLWRVYAPPGLGRALLAGLALGLCVLSSSGSAFPEILDRLASFQIASGTLGFFWDALIFLGLLFSLLGSTPLTAVTFLLVAFIPREGQWIGAIWVALLAGKGLATLVPLFQVQLKRWPGRPARAAGGGLAAIFVVMALWSGRASGDDLVHDRQWLLPAGQVAELHMLQGVISVGGLVVTLGNEALAEWAPQLLRRGTLNTVYGLEWQPNELEREEYFNQALEEAQNADQVLDAAGEFLGTRDLYLVSNDKPRAASLLTASAGGVVQVDMLADGPAINVIHLHEP